MEAFETEEQQAEAIKKWLRENGKHLMTVILMVSTVVLGFKYWRHQQEVVKIQASEHYMSLMESQMREDEQSAKFQADTLINQYAKTPYAQFAALYLAKVHVEKSELDEALNKLQWVIDHKNVNEFSLVARARAARIYMSQEQYDKAMAILTIEDGNGFTPLLEEVKGDVLMAQNKVEEAKEAYKTALDMIESKELEHPMLKLKLQELGWVESKGDQA